MELAPGPVGYVYLLAGLISLYFVSVAYRNRESPGAKGFLLFAVGTACWSIGPGIPKTVIGIEYAPPYFYLLALGTQLVGIGWLLLAIEFTGWRPISRRLVGVLGAYLFVGQVLVWTNPVHGLLLGPGTRVFEAVLEPAHGPLFWALALGLYLLIGASMLLLAGAVVTASGIRRRQAVLLLVGIVPPIVGSLVSVGDFVATPHDVTPFGYLVSEVIFAWALFRGQFLEIEPIARRTAVEEMEDAVVTLDGAGNVVDYNPAASRLVNLDDRAIGSPLSAVLDADLAVESWLEGGAEVDTDVTVAVDGQDRHFHVTVSTLGERTYHEGRIVVLRDITPLKRREQELRAREADLDLLRKILTRVLRHDLRNSLTVIESMSDLIRTNGSVPPEEAVEQIQKQTDELATLSDKASVFGRVVTQNGPVIHDLVAVLADAIVRVRDRYPDADVEMAAPEECRVQASYELGAAIEELLTNAVEHNEAGDPTVRVRVECDDEPTLVIEDDGPGIPHNEIEVLEAEEETPLDHGSGVGLWLVKWVVDHSGASIEFEECEAGATVSVQFPAVEQPIEAD